MSESPTVRAIEEIRERLDAEEYDELRAELPVILQEHQKAVVSDAIDRIIDQGGESTKVNLDE